MYTQLEWAKQQPWYHQLVCNIIADGGAYSERNPNATDLIDSFDWSHSPEGHMFWATIKAPKASIEFDTFTTISSMYPLEQFPEYYI